MHRFLFAVTVVSCAMPAVRAAEPKKPNVVVILSDDCGFNEFSMNGSKRFDTPRIDSIAKAGVQFKTGYTSGTVCSPTRAGLLTGRYQNRFGHEFNIPPAYSEANGLNLEEVIIADALKGTHGPNDALGADLKTLPNRQGNVKHRAMAAALDRAVGVVLDELDRQKIADDTLVIFVNDNGGATGHDNAPLRGHKGSTWEGGCRIPFAIRWPAALPKGQAFDHPVMTIDIVPTALAAACIAKTPGKPLDGVNLLPFATREKTGRPHPALFWKHGNAWAVRDGDSKLVNGSQDVRPPELFDLVADPTESKDLAAMMSDKVKQLRAKWDEWNTGNVKPTWGDKGD
jgi:arylsulfatase A-like enzyme